MLLLGKQQLSNLLQLANDMLMSKRCFYKSKVCTNKVIAIPELPSHERLLCTDFLIIEQYLHRRQLQAISDNDDAQTPKWHPLLAEKERCPDNAGPSRTPAPTQPLLLRRQ